MLDQSAVKALTQAEATTAANKAVDIAEESLSHVLALPHDFSLHDLEQYLPNRRRARGTMTTSVIADFAEYAQKHASIADTGEKAAAVFVDKDAMKASAVLNLGTTDEPGHADNLAIVVLEKSAAYSALLAIANGQARKQTEVAEFLEDWAHVITCRVDDEILPTGQAVAAVRTITIEQARKATSTEQQLGAERSAFESVQASSEHKLPTYIDFTVDPPYFGLSARTLTMRLSIITGDKPLIVLRIIKLQEHQELMAAEFAGLVRAALDDELPVAIGTYQAKK
jgi:uncharacterized protein YfdQ (DUF2303 family)